MMKVVAFVPAKGSSERVPNKNLTILDGEYLFKRKLRQLLECSVIDEVFLDTEDDNLAALAEDLPIRRLKRPLTLASNAVDGHTLFEWECSQVHADFYLQCLCTAPFVSAETIKRAIEALKGDATSDSLVGITKAKQYLWFEGKPSYGEGRIPNSAELPETVIEGMSLYVVKTKGGKPPLRRFGENPLMFDLTPLESIDLNWPEDVELAEIIAAGVRARENLALGALAPYLSSSILSDVTRNMGLQAALPKEIKSLGSNKIFGRAKTLFLDHTGEGESWQGIYDALNTYKFIRPGDVIMVGNRVADRAYFGNLNAQLALRAGAIGAVIDGVTRDSQAVAALCLPVFSRGHYCVDIRYEGVMRNMNMPIMIGDVPVENGDFIFGDGDGVVVIPKQYWPEVSRRSLKVIDREWKVGRSVALGKTAEEVFKTFGEF